MRHREIQSREVNIIFAARELRRGLHDYGSTVNFFSEHWFIGMVGGKCIGNRCEIAGDRKSVV